MSDDKLAPIDMLNNIQDDKSINESSSSSIDSDASSSVDLDDFGDWFKHDTADNDIANLSSNHIFNTSIKGSCGNWQLKRDYGSTLSSISTDSGCGDDSIRTSVKDRRHSFRLTKQELDLLPELAETFKAERLKEWASGFRRMDPRYKIMRYFDDAATLGIDNVSDRGAVESSMLSPILRMFAKSSCFTVWRPTSSDAIRKMILGEGVGKGLDIKGKSAKKGHLSGYVPFMQIHEETHKEKILTLPKDSSICIFFASADMRDDAAEHVALIGEEMLSGFYSAQKAMETKALNSKTKNEIMRKYMWEMIDPEIVIIDEYADAEAPAFGLEIPERLFWEAFVVRRDISRDASSKYATGRPSHPAFQDMNFASLRGERGPDEPKPVLYQHSSDDPMEVRDLIVAYEENGRVVPVVSDFDCFLVGTRSVSYTSPIPDDQIKLVNKCLLKIEKILGENQTKSSWTEKWLETLKEEPEKLEMPRYGYGDPKSISLIAMAVKRLVRDGSIRHGAECFNYTFPQELDEKFLIIGKDIDEKGTPWKYVDRMGLQEILMAKILEGFTFPLHPKWILCDPGWKKVYDALKSSTATHVQSSLDCWYPPESGIREKIEELHERHPRGFVRMPLEFTKESRISSIHSLENKGEHEGTAAMDLAQHELEQTDSTAMDRAKMKLRVVMIFMSLLKEKRNRDQPATMSFEEVKIPPPTLRIRTSSQYIPSEIEVVKKMSLKPALKERKSIIPCVSPPKDSDQRQYGRAPKHDLVEDGSNSFTLSSLVLEKEKSLESQDSGKRIRKQDRSNILPIELELSVTEASRDANLLEETAPLQEHKYIIRQKERRRSLFDESPIDKLLETEDEKVEVRRSQSLLGLRVKGLISEALQSPIIRDPVKLLRLEMINRWFPAERLVSFFYNEKPDMVNSNEFHDTLVDLNLAPKASPKEVFHLLDKEGSGEISINLLLESLRPHADDISIKKNDPVAPFEPSLLIGLVANIEMKVSMMKFLQDHIAFFRRVNFATSKSIARVLKESMGLCVKHQVSNVGSEAEISSLLVQGKMCALFSLTGQMEETFSRLCCIHNVLYANNAVTAYAVVSMLENSSFRCSCLAKSTKLANSFEVSQLEAGEGVASREISMIPDNLAVLNEESPIHDASIYASEVDVIFSPNEFIAPTSFASTDITEQTYYDTQNKEKKRRFTRVLSKMKTLGRLSSMLQRNKRETKSDNIE